jgi:hypothetical protein
MTSTGTQIRRSKTISFPHLIQDSRQFFHRQSIQLTIPRNHLQMLMVDSASTGYAVSSPFLLSVYRPDAYIAFVQHKLELNLSDITLSLTIQLRDMI